MDHDEASSIADSLKRIADTLNPDGTGPNIRDMLIMSTGAIHEMEASLDGIQKHLHLQGTFMEEVVNAIAVDRIRVGDLESMIEERDDVIGKLRARLTDLTGLDS